MTDPLPLEIVPVAVGITMAGYLQVDPSKEFTTPGSLPPIALRATSVTVLTPVAAPIVARGVPTLPEYGITVPTIITANVGPGRIESIDDPNPVWNPDSDTYDNPPGPSGVGDYRWTVFSLPGPENFTSQNYPDADGACPDGSYSLGARTGLDGSNTYPPACSAWAADIGTPGPPWQSAYPFKPLVTARDVALADGQQAHHPVGVTFASDINAHMWLDMGAPVPQPFSWVIVAMPFSPSGTLRYILDSGRNPSDVGFGTIPPDGVGDTYAVADGLIYRTTLAISGAGTDLMNTAMSASQGAGVGLSVSMPDLVCPRMYGMVFDGPDSMLWVRGPDVSFRKYGTVYNHAGFDHRYYVLGRRNGYISPDIGCQMFVFELRFWKHALTDADMEDQFAQLSSTFKFGEYKASQKSVMS